MKNVKFGLVNDGVMFNGWEDDPHEPERRNKLDGCHCDILTCAALLFCGHLDDTHAV